MTSQSEEFCATCPACVSKAKEAEAEAGLRCLVCLAAFTDPWVESETAPGYCRGCGQAVAAPKRGLGATYGRFQPLSWCGYC
jgi:hypothetical protein